MTTNIYLAKLLASEREQDFLRHAEAHRRARAAREPRMSWRERLSLLRHDPKPVQTVAGDTWIAA